MPKKRHLRKIGLFRTKEPFIKDLAESMEEVKVLTEEELRALRSNYFAVLDPDLFEDDFQPAPTKKGVLSASAEPCSTSQSFIELGQAFKPLRAPSVVPKIELPSAAVALGGAGAPKKTYAAAIAPDIAGAHINPTAAVAALGGAGAPMKANVADDARRRLASPKKPKVGLGVLFENPTVRQLIADSCIGCMKRNNFLSMVLDSRFDIRHSSDTSAITLIKALASGESEINEDKLRKSRANCHFVSDSFKPDELAKKVKKNPQHVFLSDSLNRIWVLASAVPVGEGVNWFYFNQFVPLNEEEKAKMKEECTRNWYNWRNVPKKDEEKYRSDDVSREIVGYQYLASVGRSSFEDDGDSIPFNDMSPEFELPDDVSDNATVCAICAAMIDRLFKEGKEINAKNIIASSALVHLPLDNILSVEGDKRGEIVIRNIKEFLASQIELRKWVYYSGLENVKKYKADKGACTIC